MKVPLTSFVIREVQSRTTAEHNQSVSGQNPKTTTELWPVLRAGDLSFFTGGDEEQDSASYDRVTFLQNQICSYVLIAQ